MNDYLDNIAQDINRLFVSSRSAATGIFQPYFSEQEAKRYLGFYTQSPRSFNEQQLDLLKKHLSYYRIPFAENELDNSFNILRAVKKAAAGYVQGFTTINIDKEPEKNVAEAIVKRVANLAGFIGLGASLPFKALGFTKAVAVPSLPMFLAGKATGAARKAISPLVQAGIKMEAGAAKTAFGFLQNAAVKGTIEHAFHLGAASAVSSWQGGIDQMFTSFIHGAESGAFFGAVGNLVNADALGVGEKLSFNQISKAGRPMWNKLRPGQQADLAIRTVASSLYTGLPSTLRGETAPEQVYEYLLGSYFGFSTLPQETKNARAFIVKYNADSRKGFRDPASYEGFGNFSERTQKAIRDYSVEQIQGGKLISLKKMAEAMGLKPAQIKAMLPTIGEKENLVNGANEPLLMKQYLIDPGEKLFAPVAYSIVDKINLEELGIKKIYGIEYVTRNKGNKLSLVNEENNSISLDTNKMREMYENNTYKKEPWWPTVKKVVKDFPNYLKFEEFITFMERAKINSPRGDGEIDNNEAYYTRIANIVKTIYNSETLPKENVTHIVEDFVTKNLELIYGKDRKRKAEVMDEVQRRWDELQPIDDNTGYVNSNAMLDWLKTTYEIKIDDATEMFWRQQGTRRAHGVKRALLAFNSQTNELEEVLDGRGKTKTLFAPPTVFETILNEKGKMNEPMRVVEQILTYEGYENLNELQQNKREIYNVEVQKLDTKMRDDGYYYFGGKGDKARRIYIKHHPDAGDPEVLKQIDKYLEETSWDSIQEDMKRLSPNQKVEYMKMTYSNILYDLEANFNTLNLNDLPKLSDPHMINSAMAWNKRAQVLFADAYPVDEIYIKYFNEITEKLVDDKGTIGTILVNDHKNLSQTDGSIRYIKDIVDAYNRQAGLDGSGGTAKLFTYFPGDEGAFISKGMTGANFEKEADYIAEHYGAVGIDYVSSAKQSGSRPIYDIEVNEKGESFFYETVNGKRISDTPVDKPTLVRIPLNKQRLVMSETNDKKKSLSPSTGYARQVFTNLNPFSPELKNLKDSGDTIKDFLSTTIINSFDGDREVNLAFEKVIKNPIEAEKQKTDEFKLVSSSWRRLSLKNIAELFSVAHFSPLKDRIVKEIMGVDADKTTDGNTYGFMEDELTMSQQNSDAVEFTSGVERMIQVLGDSSVHHFYSKFANRTLGDTFRKYIRNKISRPEIYNSSYLRLLPYDHFVEARYGPPKRDTFYLTKGMRNKLIKSPAINNEKPVELGALYKDYASKQHKLAPKEAVEDIFEGIVGRIPMDSMSGAQKLHLEFIDLEGYGVMVHPDVAKKLGTADYDGDKAFIYFGDGGEGFENHGKYGMKKSWKELYHAHRDEYKEGDPLDAMVGKYSVRHYMTNVPDDKKLVDVVPAIKNSALKWSPRQRQTASEDAAGGRLNLGRIISAKNQIMAAYSYLKELQKHNEEWIPDVTIPYGVDKKGKPTEIRVRVMPKAGKEITNLNKIMRGGVVVGADPMDIVSPKSAAEAIAVMEEFAFNYYGINAEGKDIGKVLLTPKQKHKLLNVFGMANNAIFGTSSTGDKWTWSEMQEKLMPIMGLGEKNIDGFYLGRVSSLMHYMNLDFTVFNSMFDVLAADRMIRGYNKLSKEGKMIGPATPQHGGDNWVGLVMNSGIFKEGTFEGQMRFEKDYYEPKFDKLAVKYRSKYVKQEELPDLQRTKPLEYSEDLRDFYKEDMPRSELAKLNVQRRANMRMILSGADRMMSEDLTTIATKLALTDIRNSLKKEQVEPFNEMVGRFARFIDEQKKGSVYRKKQEKGELPDETGILDSETGEIINSEKPELPLASERYEVIDNRIRMYKENLNPTERIVFDILALGSIKPGESKTHVSLFGLSSRAIDDVSVALFFGKFDEVFDKTRKITTSDAIETWRKDWNDKMTELEDNTDLVTSKVVYFNRIGPDAKNFLNNEDALRGLNLMKNIPKEVIDKAEDLHVQITDKLKSMPRHKFLVKNLHKIVQGMYGKNIDMMTLGDWESFNNFITSTKKGGFFEKVMNKVSGEADGKGYPIVQKWFKYLFPERIHRYMMSFGLEGTEDYGYWRRTGGGGVYGPVIKPTTIFARVQEMASLVETSTTRGTEKILGRLDDSEKHLAAYFGKDYDKIFKIIQAQRGAEGYWPDIDKHKMEIANLLEVEKEVGWENLKKKYSGEFIIKSEAKPEGERYTLDSVLAEGKVIYRNFFAEFHRVFTGDPTTLSQIRFRDRAGKIDPNKFEEYIMGLVRAGKDIPYTIGGDILNEYAVEFYKQRLGEDMGSGKIAAKLKEVGLYKTVTGEISFDQYWPHAYDKVTLEKHLEEQVEKLMHDETMPPENRAVAIMDVSRKIMQVHHNGANMLRSLYDEQFQGAIYEATRKNKESAARGMKQLEENIRTLFTGNMMERKSSLGGYLIERHVLQDYVRSNLNSYYRAISQILSNNVIGKWAVGAKNVGYPEKNVSALKRFMHLYINQAVGHYTVIPDNYLNDPDLQLEGSFYAKIADDRVAQGLEKIKTKLGLSKTMTLAGATGLKEIKLKEIEPRDVVRWANLEAKFSLATLLTHFKSAAANIYSGTANTMISTGIKTYFRGRSFKYLSALNPKWKSMSDVSRWVYELGVVEELFLEQMGGESVYKQKNVRDYIAEAGKLAASGQADRAAMSKLAAKYQIGKTVFNKMAWFMRAPERVLRRDAFMAHLVNAYEEFDGMLPVDHPILIDIAKKGVKSTQFLYCVDTNTEILTKNGWKKHSEIRSGDEIYSINKKGNLVDDKINEVHLFQNHYGIPVTKFSHSDGFEMTVTNDHRNVVQNYNSRDKKWQDIIIKRTRSLKKSNHLLRIPLGTTRVVKKVYSDDFVKLIAWVLGEGNYIKFRNCHDRHNVRITQSHEHNPEYVEEIRNILINLGEGYKEFTNRNTAFTLKKPLSDDIRRALPNKILTYDLVNKFTNEQMLLFVDTFGKADGYKRSSGEWSITQKYKDILDVLQYMLTVNGKKSSITYNKCNGMYNLNVLNSKRTHVKSLKKEQINVRSVWCPTTDTGLWIARKNNRVFITGNTAPHRPMFSNTGLGKVLTRFQLWAWNSTRFRNEILQGANFYGFKDGTPDFDKYKRFVLGDMLMIGLSSAFIYSLFEAALPQPYSWMQDWADIMFGNDKERDRAFFGSYPSPLQPLQMVTPISLRLVGPTVKAMIDGDWSRVANYHVWTMFPFGRMARDFFQKPSGIVHNPARLFEKTFGIPFQDFAKYIGSGNEANFPTPRGIL